MIIDIFDNISYFKEHCESRLSAYEANGSERIEIFNSLDKDFTSKLEEFIEINFGKRRI
jgi:hypothetical protein